MGDSRDDSAKPEGRAVEAQTPRAVCARCRRPERVCYCAHLPSLATRTRVVIVQHPRERDVPIGTAFMASLCLQGSQLFVAASPDADAALVRALSDDARPAILLYPSDDAKDLSSDAPTGPVTLVVVDGTWSQAKKLVARSPLLRALPRYSFRPDRPSEYRIRREPRADYVSTIEALALVLGALEGSAAKFRPMLAPFRAMVDAQLAHAETDARPRRVQKPRRPPRPTAVPPVFRERADDLVCVYGEANAWPYGTRERRAHAEEIVHWVAVRPKTGDTFEALIAPRGPLAPRTAAHAELDAARIAQGESASSAVARWSEFLREEDVLVAWGTYATKLFSDAGARARPSVDLRVVARSVTRAKVGTAAELLRARGLEPEPLPMQGRAARRLGEIVQITRDFIRRARDRSECATGASP